MHTECGRTASFIDPENPTHMKLINALQNLQEHYSKVHKHLSIFLCVFGILANIVHYVILTRPTMYKSTVNRLLSLMAVCDIVTMFSYLVYIIRFVYMVDPENPPFGYPFLWIVFLMGHVICSIALHTISLYLSVATAFIRFQAINRLSSRLLKAEFAWKIFMGVTCFIALLSIPTFVVHEIIPGNLNGDGNREYTVGLPRATSASCTMFILNLWTTGFFFKVLPCILLIFFTIALIYKLHQNRISHEKIASKGSIQMRGAQSDRTTILLILLLIVFIGTELPQGILAILNALFPNDIHNYIYTAVGEVLDLLSLVNGNVCFILYPAISSQYRETFSLLVARMQHNSGDDTGCFSLFAKMKRRYRQLDTEPVCVTDPKRMGKATL